MNGKQRPGCYFAHAQDDLNLSIWRMFEGLFSLDAAHLFLPVHKKEQLIVFKISYYDKKDNNLCQVLPISNSFLTHMHVRNA